MAEEVKKELDLEKLRFSPQYPQVFKINLTINSKNYGDIEIQINEGKNLSKLTGNKAALRKLADIGEKAVANKVGYYPSFKSLEEIFISYPFKDARELVVALYEAEEVEKNKELEKLRDFISKVVFPYDTAILEEIGIDY